MSELRRTEDQWKTYLQQGYENTVGSYIELGKRLKQYKDNCDSKQGGSEFKLKVKEWIGLSPSSSYQLIKIGSTELLHTMKKLPNSRGTLYELTTLSDNDFQLGIASGVINPDMTQKDITRYKQKLKATKNKPYINRQKELKTLIKTLCQKARIYRTDLDALNDECSLENIKDIGADICKENILSMFGEYAQRYSYDSKKKQKNQVKLKPKSSNDDDKITTEIENKEAATAAERKKQVKEEDELFDEAVTALIHKEKIDINNIKKPSSKEEAYYLLGPILLEIDNKELEKIIFKLIKQKCHPDKYGDDKIFKLTNIVQEKINE